MARRPLFIKLSLCQWGRKAGKVCKIQGTKELRNILFSIVKNPTQAKYIRFKVQLQKCKKKIQMSPSALCRLSAKICPLSIFC